MKTKLANEGIIDNETILESLYQKGEGHYQKYLQLCKYKKIPKNDLDEENYQKKFHKTIYKRIIKMYRELIDLIVKIIIYVIITEIYFI